MEHYELVQEMGTVERMSTQERLKHARKRRAQQLKKFAQYERQLDKESAKQKKKNQDKQQPPPKRVRKNNRGNVKFTPNIALLEAAARNDLSEVKILLERGVSPDVTNEDGLTALHQCCIDNSEEMMKLLLDFNADVNACDSELWTPLHAAATCGHMMLCKYLIDRGAELLAVNADGNMPYDICEDEVTLDHIETEMAKRGITQEQIDVTRLAGEHKMLAEVKEFVDQGGDLEMVDHTGATLLHIAAANGYVEVAEFLLDNHVCVDVRDNESWQPVHAAAYWAQQEILEMLVEGGADLDSKTKNGETPFDLCEDPDLKQKILDMKDEIETKRTIRQQRLGSQRKQRVSSRNASMRRSSMRGDKSQLFKKEHKEEALHFGLNLMNEDDSLMETEEDPDIVPSTDLDQVRVVVTSEDDKRTQPPSPPASHVSPPPPPPVPMQDATDALQPSPSPPPPPTSASTATTTTTKPSPSPSSSRSAPAQPGPAVTTITITSKPAVRPRSGDHSPGISPAPTPAPAPQSQPTANAQKPPLPHQQSSSSSSSSSSQGRSGRVPPPSSDSAASAAAAVAPPAPRSAPTQKNAAGERGATRPRAAGAQNSSGGAPPASHQHPQPRSTMTTTATTAPAPQVLPRQPASAPAPFPAPPANERRMSGSTLSDLKRQRSNSRESLLDLAVQNMFLESLQGGRPNSNSSKASSAVAGRDKAKNGHHHPHHHYSNSNSSAVHYSASNDGQLRRFVAPSSGPVVGGDEGTKQKCCVIL